MHVSTRLDDTQSGRQVWAARFDERGNDPEALADAVAGRIISALAVTKGELTRAEYARVCGKDSASLGEYDYAMQAHDRMFGDNSAQGNAAATAILKEGLARYTGSAHLKLKLAWNDWRRAYNFWSDDMAPDFSSIARLARELEATPNLTPCIATGLHGLLSNIAMREGDWGRVLREAELTASLAPYDAFQITDLAETLAPAGAYDQALANIDFGAARNPADADYQHALRAWALRMQGRLKESARESQAARMLLPYQRLQYAITLVRLGQIDQTRAEVRAAPAEDSGIDLGAWRGATVYADPAILPGGLAGLATAGLPE
ncbi:hypothetical protein [Paracoccus litorisediminis]|uniref:DUF4034 domain-containing protein n=1 Tax=Paracoccus litorisediminis TaxID=2006130 RepID=A0A844HNT8_9RHOB|nr:hypothetical protein [Paracoccus litorisediminis]MTH59312.1 hypothetical protein [Paracoccus litorisediminis]